MEQVKNTLIRLMHRGAACQWHAFSTDRAGRRDLISKSRLYVHLSSDMETAKKVGSRHGKPVIYEIDCRQMAEDGYPFFESANHIWMTKTVPMKYLKRL